MDFRVTNKTGTAVSLRDGTTLGPFGSVVVDQYPPVNADLLKLLTVEALASADSADQDPAVWNADGMLVGPEGTEASSYAPISKAATAGYGNMISVKEYGITSGNYKAALIQELLDKGAGLYFPNGEYHIDDGEMLVLGNNAHLKFQSPNAKIVYHGMAAPIYIRAKTGIHMEGGTIDSTPGAMQSCCISFYGCKNSSFVDMTLIPNSSAVIGYSSNNFNGDIDNFGGKFLTFKGLKVAQGHYGLWLERMIGDTEYLENIVIEDCDIAGVETGMRITGMRASVLRNNSIRGCTIHAATIGSTSNSILQHGLVTGNAAGFLYDSDCESLVEIPWPVNQANDYTNYMPTMYGTVPRLNLATAADDTAAAGLGIPLNGLYKTAAGAFRIRVV